jgi:hypothetical protein
LNKSQKKTSKQKGRRESLSGRAASLACSRPWVEHPLYHTRKIIKRINKDFEIRTITVQSQSRQIVREILSQKNPTQNGAGGVAQDEDLEFKYHYCKNKQR